MEKEKMFKREKGVSGLKEFAKEHGSFNDYSAEAGASERFTSKKKKTEMFTRTLVDAKSKHLGTIAEVNELQDSYPDVDILLNEAGNRAEMGEMCYVSEQIPIGRDDGILVL